MYESFYGFREKPFSLLPDSGFLYLSSKHQMALTLLEYGLMSQAGFSVISGDIGTGKTTLIRKLLGRIDNDIRVGLISNTHQSFGELMMWVALAFDLPHTGKDKVQLYQMFVDFIINEYAQGRRTVLIVDEAQNMSAETLEELRMLSNINADKDQVLQIILVGQRELRDTLRRPDLVQFAQRIAVDYHLEPLSDQETTEYIQHRCKVAGGKPDLFSDQACEAVFELTSGVPRLINTLCDTVLVYGYAEQRERIDAALVRDVGREKQQGGLFPSRTTENIHTEDEPATNSQSRSETIKENHLTETPAPDVSSPKKPRIAIVTESDLFRGYLSRMLETLGVKVVYSQQLNQQNLLSLDLYDFDALLIELDSNVSGLDQTLYQLLQQRKQPALITDSHATKNSLSAIDKLAYGRELYRKINSLVYGKQYVA